MEIIWLIEGRSALAAAGSLATMLAGNFPVRLFASLRSLATIYQLEKPALPALLVVNGPSLNLEAANIHRQLPKALAPVALFWVDPATFAKGANLDLALVKHVRDALDRREKPAASGMQYRYKNMLLDMERNTVRFDENDKLSHGLTGKEARLLRQLIMHQGSCISREELQVSVWSEVTVSPRTIDSHISRLRRHLEPVGIEIRNVYGSGYSLL